MITWSAMTYRTFDTCQNDDMIIDYKPYLIFSFWCWHLKTSYLFTINHFFCWYFDCFLGSKLSWLSNTEIKSLINIFNEFYFLICDITWNRITQGTMWMLTTFLLFYLEIKLKSKGEAERLWIVVQMIAFSFTTPTTVVLVCLVYKHPLLQCFKYFHVFIYLWWFWNVVRDANISLLVCKWS